MKTKLFWGLLMALCLTVATGANAANIMFVENDIDDGAAFGDNGTAQDDAHHLAHWVTWLESAGHTVTLKSAAGLLAAVDAATDMSAFDLIIIGRDLGSGTFNNSKDALAAVTVPILSMQGKPFQGDRSTWWEHSNWDDGDNNNNYTAMVTMPSHAIFNGLAVPGDGIFDFTEFANSDCIEAPFGAGNSATVIATVAQRTGGDATGVGAPYIAYWAAGTPYFTGGLTPMSNRMVLTAGGGVDDPEIPAGLTNLVDEKDGLFDLTRGGAQVFMNAIAFLTTGSVPAGGVSHTYVLPQAVPPGGGDGGGPDYSAGGEGEGEGECDVVVNGSFDDNSGWTITNLLTDDAITATITGGRGEFVATGHGDDIFWQWVDLEAGQTYDGSITWGTDNTDIHFWAEVYLNDGGIQVPEEGVGYDQDQDSRVTLELMPGWGTATTPQTLTSTFTYTAITTGPHVFGVKSGQCCDAAADNSYTTWVDNMSLVKQDCDPGEEPPEQDGVISNTYPPYIDEGSTIILTARDGGGYQWSKDGVEIPGATNRTLVFDPITEADAATYSVTFNDGTGVVTEGIEITVNPEGSVPVAGGLGLAALMGASALAGAGILRRRKK